MLGGRIQLRQLVRIYKSFADTTRLRILHLLAVKGELKVGQISEALQLPQSTVSRQLALLRAASLVQDERDGKWVGYSITEGPLLDEGEMPDLLRAYGAVCPELKADLERLNQLSRPRSRRAAARPRR
jgi:ArsR family transcriptional regulator